MERVNFLGYEIELNKIRPKFERSQGIIDYQRPKNKKSLQRFLGMINYDRMFLKEITNETKPLYKLLEKEQKYALGEEPDKAFQKIKENLKKKLELVIPDVDKKFEMKQTPPILESERFYDKRIRR